MTQPHLISQNNLKWLFLLFIFTSCGDEAQPVVQIEGAKTSILEEKAIEVNTSGTTISKRFPTPEGFNRNDFGSDSYGHYLRHLPLKPHGSEVKLYNGQSKPNYEVYDAVVDMKIGTKDLHQCADAVMRFRAEYLWKNKKFDQIHFNFTNGFKVDYTNWMKGQRLRISGNSVSWVDKNAPSNTYVDFWNYMEAIFTYAGTLSLSKELKSVEIKDLQVGDLFIRGGSPGHAVLVVDVAENLTKEKVFLLAQSYMPAQETQVLKNPNNEGMSPWYVLKNIQGKIVTPEWTFSATELMRFND